MLGNKLTIFLIIAIFILVCTNVLVSAREITVDKNASDSDFKSIQETVNNSSPGDTIIVKPGTYEENVNVSVENISVIASSGEPENTIVRAFNLSKNKITLKGFTVQETLNLQKDNFYELGPSDLEYCTVKNNVLKGGIDARDCYNSSIDKNIILNRGISVSGPDYSNFTISDNIIVDGRISVYKGPYHCILVNNTLLNESIMLTECGYNKIIGNHISNSQYSGISLWESYVNEIKNNTVINCSNGISMSYHSSENIIDNNTLIRNNKGIFIEGDGGGGQLLLNNTILKNNIGISMGGDSSGNLVANNRVGLNKEYGIYLKEIADTRPFNRTNQFYNNIFNNTINFFNNTSSYTGNYYIANAKNINSGKFSVSLNTTESANSSTNPNIIGGPNLGGNFWAKPDGTGFSQTCNDWNKDGIGDLYYTTNTYDIDYFPLVSTNKQEKRVFPVANFSTNITGGNVPLSVQFMDFSQNATSRVWDFDNDGIIDSTNETAVYTYPLPRTYTANLTVSNANGTSSKLYPITASDRPSHILIETQITTNISNQTMPAIYGDKIVYLDDRNGEWGRYNIYVYNLTSAEETQITTNSSYFDPSKGPAIYDNTIVWQGHHYNNGVWENTGIHIYNLSTLKETQIINSVSASHPDIYEDRIVYLDALGDGEICMYNLSTDKKIRITTNESRPHNFDIYGDIVVWQDSRNGESYDSGDIYVYNLSTSTEMRITPDNLDRYSPEVYKDKIIWGDSSSGRGNIYMYNLSTSEEIRITTGNFYLGSYFVHGDRVVWVDDRNQNPDIYMYNTSTHTENRIASNESGQGNPSIYGNRIVWTDWRNKYKGNVHPDPYIENTDIYMCTISAVEIQLEKPVAEFFANKISGNAPLKVLFTDNSTGAPTFWHWDFGDGTSSKHALNATHTFTEPGKYDVSLTVTNENGSNTRLIPEYISVTGKN